MSEEVNTSVAADELRRYIERIERCTEEVKSAQDDVKDIYQEAKSSGLCTKTMRMIVAMRAKDKHVLDEEQMMLETYKVALGMA